MIQTKKIQSTMNPEDVGVYVLVILNNSRITHSPNTPHGGGALSTGSKSHSIMT